jgi:hypothetical protein
LAGITAINITDTIFAKIDGVDGHCSPQIYFNPTVGSFTDPTCPAAIDTIIDI